MRPAHHAHHHGPFGDDRALADRRSAIVGADVNLAGERAAELAGARFYDATRAAKLHNLYGPTEDTTCSTCALIDRGTEAPIRSGGRSPTPGSTCWIASATTGAGGRHGRALHRWRWSGARLSGNRPELTAEKFVPDPFAAAGGADVSHGGSGALPGQWRPRVSGPARRSGEDPGLPDRAGRDRGGAGRTPRRAPGRGARAGRHAGRQAPGGLRGAA